MIYALAVLGGLVVGLLVLRERDARQLQKILAGAAIEREREAVLLERALERAESERASLLDRIQHPERVQVQPVEREAVEPPRDSAELAYIGQIVPDGIQVGTDGTANN
jgi:hypothetical protein